MNKPPQLKLLSFTSTDGYILQGGLYSSGNSGCVIHVPGLAGNFYSSSYHTALCESYAGLGYDYLSINTRGSEYIKKLSKVDGSSSKLFGYTFEQFDECDRDLLGAIDYLHNAGYRDIILQGHSSGCQKILYTVSHHKIDAKHIILLSPCDDIGLARQYFGEEELASKIELAINSKDEILPFNFYFNHPVSPKGFLSHFGSENHFDIFHYYTQEKPFTELENNHLPTEVIFGEKDYISDVKKIEDIYNKLSNYQLHFIPGADHKYRGIENILAKTISEILLNENKPKIV